MKAYRIMSINVLGKYPQHEREDEITEKRMKTIAECVEHYGATSVGVQEHGTQNKKFLLKHLPSRYVFVDFGQEWIATFYDSDILTPVKAVCKKLTTSSNQGYRFTLAVFKDREGSLAYMHGNLHLEYKDKETRLIDAREVNEVIEELFAESEEYRALPLVITGDYNSTRDGEPGVYENIAGDYNIKDSEDIAHTAEPNQKTFHPLGVSVGAGSAIDHALVNADTTEVYFHNVIKEDDYEGILEASDHYPVLVEFSKK